MATSLKGQIAIKQPVFTKIEVELQGGLAINSNRINLIEAEVVMGYDYNGVKLKIGDKVILKGDAGLAQWAKQKLVYKGLEFVLCPESAVLGVANE